MEVLDPHTHAVFTGHVPSWRMYLKERLLIDRQYKSDFSGKTLHKGCDMHEGILSRAKVPKSIKWHYRIFHEYNCFLLLPEEHIPLYIPKEFFVQRAYELYGRDNVREWYYSLPFKAIPFHLT